jgi:hypothetical protein
VRRTFTISSCFGSHCLRCAPKKGSFLLEFNTHNFYKIYRIDHTHTHTHRELFPICVTGHQQMNTSHMTTGLSLLKFVIISIVYSLYIHTLSVNQFLLPSTSCYIAVIHRLAFLDEQDVVKSFNKKKVASSKTLKFTHI